MKPQPSERPMPHDLAAERAVLGALIVDQRCATSVFDVLQAADFYLPANAQLFALIRRMVQHAEPVDIITLCSRVLEQDAEVYGGAGYVASLPEHCVSPSAAPHYAATVRHASPPHTQETTTMTTTTTTTDLLPACVADCTWTLREFWDRERMVWVPGPWVIRNRDWMHIRWSEILTPWWPERIGPWGEPGIRYPSEVEALEAALAWREAVLS